MDERARRQTTELLTALADGERSAFAPLYAALWPIVRGFCRRALASDADGDDAAQEALVRVFERAAEFDPERDATSWALGIAAWQCRTVRRRQHRRREAPTIDEAVEAASPELATLELEAAAVAVLETLRPADIRAILAMVNDDDSLRDGLPPATFRKRLERALGRLRIAWRSRHGAL